MKAQSEIDRLAAKYKKHGVTQGLILKLVEEWGKEGFSCSVALTGVRLGLANMCHEEEYFTIEEMAAAMSVNCEEIRASIEANKAEFLKRGPLVTIDPRAMELLQGGASHE